MSTLRNYIFPFFNLVVAIFITILLLEFGQRLPNEIAISFAGDANYKSSFNKEFAKIQLPILGILCFIFGYAFASMCKKYRLTGLIIINIFLISRSILLYYSFTSKGYETPVSYHIAHLLLTAFPLIFGGFIYNKFNSEK